ncbi:ferrous iron transport protein A [Pseudodesulfovibrio cashew]|uniref:Ferrous iron transport protein A n=1 Tax=Pseudodesulfovibrio cashew TaxID=2678688 RepID=A0A6I6JEK8_9BACT|nr:FeoA family protein [Pseudodesulfovibrio cashew]QGY40581.1 ferrous iron transport protein A [Pseudodesulfovibrio cashew]
MTQKPLTEYPEGAVVRIADINGGQRARARMLAMGMTPGCPVEVLSDGPSGRRVRVRGSEVVLCCGLAGKIMAVDNDSDEGPHCNCCPAPTRKVS